MYTVTTELLSKTTNTNYEQKRIKYKPLILTKKN